MRLDRSMRGLILWDIDGTLLTTGPAGQDAFLDAMTAATGQPITRLADTAGRTDPVIFTNTLALNGVTEQDGWFARFHRLLDGTYRERLAEIRAGGRVLPGVPELLDGCREVGAVQTVLTGNVRAAARFKLEAFGLQEWFRLDLGAYGDDHADRARLVALARERAAESPVVIVGDTIHDVSAARANGVPVVGVATGRFSSQELRAAGASAVFEDLTDGAAVQAALRRCLAA